MPPRVQDTEPRWQLKPYGVKDGKEGAMFRNMIICCVILGLFVSAQSASSNTRYDYELAYGYGGRDSEYRNAADMDDWLERGHAFVTESPLFADGIRLSASASGEEDAYEPGLASAIYQFVVPRWARYVKVTVRYQALAHNDKMAGRLWIKSIGSGGAEELPRTEGDAPFYGDTFVLRSDRTAETIIVPRTRHVEDDRMAMHIVAEGRQCLDIQYVRVDYLQTTPASIAVVHRAYRDYWDRWPRHRYVYHYYYWGPLYWPVAHMSYECWDVPARFYWVTWRPWFFIFIGKFHSHSWWEPRRYTVIYHKDIHHPLAMRRTILRGHLRERHEHATRTSRVMTVNREAPRITVQSRPSHNQEIRLKRARQEGPRIFEPVVNQDHNTRHVQEQSVREDKRRERVAPDHQTKTVNSQAVSHGPDVRTAQVSSPEARHRQDLLQPRSVKKPSRPNLVAQDAVKKTTAAETSYSYQRRQEQLPREPKKSVKETAAQPKYENRQPQERVEVQRSQTRIAEMTPPPAPQQAVQLPSRDHSPSDDEARRGRSQERPTMREEKTPRPHHDDQEPRSHGGKRGR